MLNSNPKNFRILQETRLNGVNPEQDLSHDIRLLLEKQNQSGKIMSRIMTLVAITSVLTCTWVYGPELAAIVVDRFQNKSISLAGNRFNRQIATRSRAFLPIVEASETAVSQYLQPHPRWQAGASVSLKIVRSVLIVASQLYYQ
jgi:hypothetical protein